MKDEVLARDDDWSGNTGYYRDENGERITVGVNDKKRFLEDVAQSGRKVEKIPTRRYVDRAGEEYTVPEDRMQDFFYEMSAKGSKKDYAEIVDWERNGEIMSLPMWREQEQAREKMKQAGWNIAGQKDTENGWSALDFDHAIRQGLSDPECWGVVRDPETGDVQWGETAAEVGERLGRGVAGATAAVATGAAEMVGDAVVNTGMLAARGVSSAAGMIGADGVERSIDEGLKEFRQGYEGAKQSVHNWIVDDVLGDTITQGTRMGKDLAEFGVGAGETYGSMKLGLEGIAKVGGAAAVPVSFGVAGAENTLEDEQVRAKGDWTARALALTRGVTDAVAGMVIGKIMKVFGVRGADKEIKQTLGKAVATALGETIEGGVVMGTMEAVNQAARGVAGVEDQMVDADGNATEDPAAAVGFREATVQERVDRSMNALLHGTVMTLGLKAAELAPRMMYRGGMAKAVSYDVEKVRKSYAPVVAARAKTASALQRAGLPLDRGVYHDVKGVTTNGEVEFKDGSVYYPAKPTRDVVVDGKIVTIEGREERIVVSDGTVLNAKGDVVGKLAGGQRLDRTVDTQTEAYARMTDPEAASGQAVTVFDVDTGRAAELPDNILEIAPKAYREYNKWLMGVGRKADANWGEAPKLDAESLAFGEIINRLRMGGDSMHAAQMALGDVKAGRRTCREAVSLLRQAEAQVTGKELVSVRSENSADAVADRESGIINPMPGAVMVDVKPGKNGELPKTVVDSAADIVELGKAGEIKPEEVDLTKVDHEPTAAVPADPAKDANGEHGPIVLRLNGKTGRLEVVDGNKRITEEKGNGAKTVEAVVLREEDGWTADNAQAVKDVANITSGNLDAKGMVEAFGRLGMSEEQAISKGLIGTWVDPDGKPTENVVPGVENLKRKSARNIAELGCDGLRGLVTDHNLIRVSAIAESVNARTVGEGWQDLQMALAANMENLYGAKFFLATKFVEMNADVLSRGVKPDEMIETAKYYAEHVRELIDDKVSGYEKIRERMLKDEVSRVPVVTPEGEVKTLEEASLEHGKFEVSDAPDGVGKVSDLVQPERGLELKASEGGEGEFSCAQFPELKVKVAKDVVEISGVDAETLLDNRNLYGYAKVIGELVERMNETQRLIMPVGTERAFDVLMRYYDSSVKKTAEGFARGRTMLELLEKSGLGNGVITDEAEFNRALASQKGGQALVADGLTYGWTDGQKVYLNPKFFGTRAGLNTKIHEFGHLAWIKTKTVNRALYDRGMELAGKMTDELEALRKTSGYENYSEEKLKEEILVKLIGDRGEAIEAKVPKGIVAEVKAWINEVWRAFGAQFGIADLDAAKVEKMSIEEIADAVRAEMLSGRKFGEMRMGDARGKIAAARAERPLPSKATGEIAKDAKPVEVQETAVNGGTTIDDADGKPMYSIFSMKHDLKKGDMIRDLVSSGVFDKKRAKVFEGELGKLVKKLEGLIEKDARRQFLLDVGETFDKDHRPFSAWKPNSDPLYKLSLDFSTLCKKRVLTQYVIERLELERAKAERGEGPYKVMSAEHQMAIREMLTEYQKIDKTLQVACHLCYVEAARLKAPKQINRYLADPERVLRAYFAKRNSEFNAGVKEKQARFKVKLGYEADTPKTEMKSSDATKLNNYSMEIRQAYKPSAEERKLIDEGKKLAVENYLTAENLAKLHDTHPEVFEAYTTFVRESTHSKSLETDVPYYYGDTKGVISDKMVQKMGDQGTGFRHQSWSDFQMRHLLDTIVAVAELSTRAAKMHAYTKVENFVELFGRTGIQINMSLIPTVDGRGFDAKEGMDFEVAKRLRDKFAETAGTIAISMSDAHLLKLLDNPDIDYVIPYHVSGLNKQLRKMVGIDQWKDATKVQHEKRRSDGKSAGEKDNVPTLKEWLIKDMRDGRGYEAMEKSARRYVQLCNERGLVPKFAGVEGLLRQKRNGDYEIVNRNYWKLLIDHKMVNQKTGTLIEQKPVRPEFDFKGIDKIIDREVADYNPNQMDEAYEYVRSRLPELGKRTAKLKKEGAYNKLVAEMDAAEDALRKKDGAPMLNRPEIGDGEEDSSMLARPRVEFVGGRQRVANDENRGERTPGMIEASRELATQPTTPIAQLGRFRKMSLPISELEWLRQKLTGNNVPAHIARNLPGGAASASNRAGKLVIAADVFGDVDRTDMAAQKQLLIAGGFFKNEDPTWCAGQTVQAIRAEKRRSENQLGIQLENLAARRTSGNASGGEAAARGVFADELANIIMRMDHVPAGTGLGNVRTIGEGIRRAMLNGAGGNEDAVRDEAGAFLDWAYGPRGTFAAVQNGAQPIATRDMPLEDLTSRMFGALLTMPDEVERRAPRWSAEMRNAICSDQRTLAAFRELSLHMVSEQAHERMASIISKSLDRDTEALVARLEAEGQEPIEPKTMRGKLSEFFQVVFHDKMAPVAVRVTENMRIYRNAKRKAIAAERDPAIKAQLAAELGRFEGQMGRLMDKMELARLAMERGAYNEGRRYIIRQLMLVNESQQRKGLSLEDMCLYLDQQRVIETQGRAASHGETPRQAQLVLDSMQRRLGPAGWQAMQEFAGKWWALHEQEFLSDPRLRAAYGDDYVNYLETKTHYVTTARTWTPEQLAGIERMRNAARLSGVHGGDDVVEDMFAFGGKLGMGASEGLVTAKLVGSFAAKKNVMAATWEKVDRAENFLRRNEYVRSLRDTLLAAGVEGVRDVARADRGIPENDRYGRLNYLENGQKRTLVVPKQIADGFQHDPKRIEQYAKFYGLWRKLIIDWNPAYWNRNVARNSGSIEKNMPGTKESWVKTLLRPFGLGNITDACVQHLVRHFDKSGRLSGGLLGEHTIFGLIPKARRMAALIQDPGKWQQELWAADDAGNVQKVQLMQQDLAETLQMLKGNMLVPLKVVNELGNGTINDVLAKRGYKTIERIGEEYRRKGKLRKVVDFFTWIHRRNADQQAFEDDLAKITAYLHDRINYGNVRTVEESGRKVAENVSIAQGERHGRAKGLIQATVASFFNMVEKGIVRNVKAHVERPGEMVAKDAKVVTGVIIGGLIYNGVISALIRKLFGDDEQAVKEGPLGDAYEFCEQCRQAHKNYSTYVRENFNCFPLWTSPSGKTSVIIGMPYNDEDKVLVPGAQYVAAKIAESMGLPVEASGKDAITRSTIKAITPDLALTGPAWTLLRDLPWALFVDNPPDFFKGGQLYDKAEYAMKGESFKDAANFGWSVAKQVWNDMGGRSVYQFDRPGIDGKNEEPAFVDVMLRRFPWASPVLRSFIKVQTGDIDKYSKVLDEKDQRIRDITTTLRREAAEKSTDDSFWSMASPQEFDAWMEENAKRYGLDFETVENIRGLISDDWLNRLDRPLKEMEKSVDVKLRADRLGIRGEDIVD